MTLTVSTDTVALHRLFEARVLNDRPYANKFRDVELRAEFWSPAGRRRCFWGFHAGDGDGGQEGDVWKLRFMPTDVGPWHYRYEWSDGAPGGEGSFACVARGASPGVLQPYEHNPRWLAYNGSQPVVLRSYYVGKVTHLPLEWTARAVYQPLIRAGYNHLQFLGTMNRYLHARFADGPVGLQKELGRGWDMDMEAWQRADEHMLWLNEHDIMAHHWVGLGQKKGDWVWEDMSAEEKEVHIRYAMARWAPLANQAGWGYDFEVQAPDDFMDLVEKYDPWNHLRGGQNRRERVPFRQPKYTWLTHSEYYKQAEGSPHTPHSYHERTREIINRLEPAMPLVQNEGDLWHAEYLTSAETLRRLAWAVVTAGAHFTWQWACTECPRNGFNASTQLLDTPAAGWLNILYEVLDAECDHVTMRGHDELLIGRQLAETWVLAEPGWQYLVYAQEGGTFELSVERGRYRQRWVDVVSGRRHDEALLDWPGGPARLAPPSPSSDWVLVLRRDDLGRVQDVEYESRLNDRMVRIKVYTPPDYDSGVGRYPVVYNLHGGGGGSPQRQWERTRHTLVTAMAEGRIRPVIYVFVDGLGDTLFVDYPDGTVMAESTIVRELIPFVDRTYRTLPRREQRVIEGFSMGGFGSLMIGLKYPQLFGAVVGYGSALLRPEELDLARDRRFGSRAHFDRHSPWHWAERNADNIRAGQRVRMVCGTQDRLYPSNVAFRELLEKLSVAVSWEAVSDVGHETGDLYRRAGVESLKFVFGDAWKSRHDIIPEQVRSRD